MNQPIEIFCCAADVDRPFLGQFVSQFAPHSRQDIKLWDRSQILTGTGAEKEIREHLNNAQIFLLLISPDFLIDSYCHDTVMRTALAKHAKQEAITIPVIIRPADWKNVPILNTLQVLPRDGQPISGQPDQDRAFWEVSKEIDTAVQKLREPLVESNSGFEYGAYYGPYSRIDTGKISSPTPRNKQKKIGVLLVLIAILIAFGGGTAFGLYASKLMGGSISSPTTTQVSPFSSTSTVPTPTTGIATATPTRSAVGSLSSPQLPFTFSCNGCPFPHLEVKLTKIETDASTQSTRWFFTITDNDQYGCSGLDFVPLELIDQNNASYDAKGEGTLGHSVSLNSGQSIQLSPSFRVIPQSGTRYSMQMGISTISDFSAYHNTYQPEDFQFT